MLQGNTFVCFHIDLVSVVSRHRASLSAPDVNYISAIERKISVQGSPDILLLIAQQ